MSTGTDTSESIRTHIKSLQGLPQVDASVVSFEQLGKALEIQIVRVSAKPQCQFLQLCTYIVNEYLIPMTKFIERIII